MADLQKTFAGIASPGRIEHVGSVVTVPALLEQRRAGRERQRRVAATIAIGSELELELQLAP